MAAYTCHVATLNQEARPYIYQLPMHCSAMQTLSPLTDIFSACVLVNTQREEDFHL